MVLEAKLCSFNTNMGLYARMGSILFIYIYLFMYWFEKSEKKPYEFCINIFMKPLYSRIGNALTNLRLSGQVRSVHISIPTGKDYFL